MRRLFLALSSICLLASSPAYAVMEDYPSVKLQGLDKSVGRTVTFEAKVGSTIQYGPLFIKIHACRKAPPIEQPESAAFLQIWEVPPGEEKSEWVFSGWMFASSPALSAMDHPVYDVWVLDCLGKEQPNAEAQAAETKEEADQSDLPAADGAAPASEPAPQEVPPVVDSEAEESFPAEEQTAPEPAPASEPVPVPETENLPVDSEAEPVIPEDTVTAPQENEAGFTAYDLMRPEQQPQQQQPPAQDSAPVPLTPGVPPGY
ncbi:MAG TPA: DUF2155 domain-containing protein [Micavibrio sp.]|nr:DUF2155 domain-containing protein [Micavibrio sp.]